MLRRPSWYEPPALVDLAGRSVRWNLPVLELQLVPETRLGRLVPENLSGLMVLVSPLDLAALVDLQDP